MLKSHPPKYRNGECSRCGGENEHPDWGRYCTACKTAMQKERRAKHREERKTLVQRVEALEKHLGITTDVSFQETA